MKIFLHRKFPDLWYYIQIFFGAHAIAWRAFTSNLQQLMYVLDWSALGGYGHNQGGHGDTISCQLTTCQTIHFQHIRLLGP